MTEENKPTEVPNMLSVFAAFPVDHGALEGGEGRRPCEPSKSSTHIISQPARSVGRRQPTVAVPLLNSSLFQVCCII